MVGRISSLLGIPSVVFRFAVERNQTQLTWIAFIAYSYCNVLRNRMTLPPPLPSLLGRGGSGGEGRNGSTTKISLRPKLALPLIPSPSPRSTGEKGAIIHARFIFAKCLTRGECGQFQKSRSVLCLAATAQVQTWDSGLLRLLLLDRLAFVAIKRHQG